MELNLQGIDEILNPTTLQDPSLDLDLTGIDDILIKPSSISSDKIIFQPENADWSLSRLSSIQDYFVNQFGKPLPISNIGQGKIHKKWSYDHRESADIGLNPSSKEGKKLISYLRENNIPFLAFNKAISGISTGPHIHIGRPSHKIKQNLKIDEVNQELDLTGLDEILSQSFGAEESNLGELDLSEINNIQAPLDLTHALNPKDVDFTGDTKKIPALLSWMTKYNKPVISGQDPNELGPIVKNSFDNPENNQPTVNQLTDAWLEAWNPEYKELNDRFRLETGGLNIAVVDSRGNYKFSSRTYSSEEGPQKVSTIEVFARPTRGVKALFEAYKNGGLREFNATNMLINYQLLDRHNKYIEVKENIKEYEKKHPYLSAFESAFQHEAQSITGLITNIAYLDKAVAVGSNYGYNSKQYTDLIEQERQERETIEELGSTIYQPPNFAGKVLAGATGGVLFLPRAIVAGKITGGLPTMVYMEHLHRGNREAALSALPMALMVGTMHGAQKFLSATSGTAAPFKFPPKTIGKFTKEDLSIFQETLINSKPVTIQNVTPLTRQLILRGGNALILGGTAGIQSQSLEEGVASFVVGLTFPVGKAPREFIFPEFVPTLKPRVTLPLGETRINVPVTKTELIAENIRSVGPEFETGFQARSQGQTLHLDLDTANLNLLELKRALEEHTYRIKGDDLKTTLQKQQAIKDAINILEEAIPDSTKEFFKENEQAIRAALRTNYEARFGKENFLKQREEFLKPEDIKLVEPEIPKVETLKDSSKKIFEGKAGDENLFTSQEKAAQILKDFFKITKQGSLQSSLLPYADVLARKAQDLGYLSAFYIEDFYRRGITPTADLVLNRIKGSIGDFGKYISDNQARKIFEDGINFYNSNVADPFFSRMKMDITEKLPNRFTVEQARNILALHKIESEWTTGLNEFLQSKEGQKISKRELINIIQEGQVRVEESIAQEYSREQILNMNRRADELRKQISILNEINDKSDRQISEQLKLEEQLELIQEERVSLSRNVPKYSLERYTTEKLELPGAKNSKEVKLISVLGEVIGSYESPHWDERGVVAHYRANERTTTDNQRIYFGEEFQSDQAHDIKEYGAKITFKEAREYAENNVEEVIERGRTFYRVKPRGNETIVGNIANTREGAIENFVIVKSGGGIEKMPFMGHNWKELVLKRFLRDAAIAKDEDGNYKYDGIGWTTARQQLERYHGILEGKHFFWKKNSDGTYSFDMSDSHGNRSTPHELQNISMKRFAELTTKEAADFVRQQEIQQKESLKGAEFAEYRGQFSLSETVELRSKEGTYADYDIAYKNIVSKIGKRFGAKYSEKEIFVSELDPEITPQSVREADRYKQKIHYLEITSSMRQSLEKEGLPLFGLGGLDHLKNPEIGIRNVLTTREAFNEHRDLLVKSLEAVMPKTELTIDERAKFEKAILEANKEDLDNTQLLIEGKKQTLFDSGLTPDQFVDQAKLLYRNYETFPEFSKDMINRFGDKVKPFLEDLWKQVKGIAKAFHEDERGFLNIQLRRMQTDAEKRYRTSKKKTFYYDNYSIHRGIMLAQRDPMAGIVYDVMRTGQRDKKAFESNVLADLRRANKAAKKHIEQDVADTIFIGNETQRLFTDAELVAGDPTTNRPSLNPDQIQAYRDAYKAEHRNLDKRLQHVLFGYRERADRLNNKLANTVPGSPEHTNILNQLLDISDAINKVTDHYKYLKDTGYISLKRKGPIAAFVQDPAFPKGDKRGEVYNQFNSIKEAGDWVAAQEKLLGANPSESEIYDVNIPQRLRAAASRMTPAQFEELIDSSGVNSRAIEIEQLRDEIYSRFPSKGYELKRDYVRGYDRSWPFIMESIANQTESYANSFYSRVAGEHGIKALEATGLQQTKPDLYKVLQKYIDHEISSPERSRSSQLFTGIRKGVYLFQLGFDVNQLYLNAIAQPITQTYSYFARVSHNGKMLGPFEAEKYWIDGWNLAGQVAKKSLTGKGKVPAEFEVIRNQLIEEGVITPEFNKLLLESEAEKTVSTKLKPKSIRREIEHWAGVFMRAGEKTTRSHAAAEAYLVGKNKFNLSGDELTNFIVRAIDATQTNSSRAEAPLVIRGTQNQGEVRKLLYQFNAFNHMWLENLALNVKADFAARRISATSRHLIPLAIMGGIAGLPLSGIAAGLYTLITDKDPKEEFNKYINNFPLLEKLALYGITGNATLSRKIVPTAPFAESLKVEDTITDTVTETLSTSAIPALSTTGQITRGFDDLLNKDYLRAAGGLVPFKPLRNAATVIRYKQEGVKTRKGTVIIPRSKITTSQLLFQGAGIPPSPVTEYYNKQNQKDRTKKVKKLRKILL